MFYLLNGDYMLGLVTLSSWKAEVLEAALREAFQAPKIEGAQAGASILPGLELL